MAQRMILSVLEVKEPIAVGEKGAKKLGFRGRDKEGKEAWYFSFRNSIFDYIKLGTDIDVEVETSERKYQGNTYVDRKVTQLFVNGQPMGGQQASGQRGRYDSPEQRTSIEAQTAFKGVVELMVAGIIKPEYLLAKAAINWAADRFGIKYLPEAKAATKKAEKAQPAQPAKVPEFNGSHITNYGELWSRCKNYGMTKAEGLKLASVKDQSELTDLDEAWKIIFNSKFEAGEAAGQ